MKFQLCLLIGLVVSLGSYQHANAEDTTDTGRVSAVVELSDGELQSLLQTGTFKMSIPVSYKNKVDSLILKRPDRFKDDVAVLFNEVEKRSGTIAINRLSASRTQSLRIGIYKHLGSIPPGKWQTSQKAFKERQCCTENVTEERQNANWSSR